MTVRDLIEALEELPADLPVTDSENEITEIFVREEVYFSADHEYKEGLIVKIY